MTKLFSIYRRFQSRKPMVFVLLLVLIATSSSAQPIYKGKSSTGKSVLYTSKRAGDETVESKLPSIKREEVKSPAKIVQSCGTHGGVNCDAGPDGDGSTVCFDGFRNSQERFNFKCTAPRLQLQAIKEGKEPSTFTVLIRNFTSISAENVSILFLDEQGKKRKLAGPNKLLGFGIGEYVGNVSKGLKKGFIPPISSITVSCANCL